jgi:hypothetical protein
MNLATLKTEITNDPAALGYAGKDDAQVADLMNAPGTPGPNFNADRAQISGAELACAIDATEFGALSANARQYVSMVCSAAGTLTAANVKAAFGGIFSPAAAPISRAAILALFPRTLSRAEKVLGEKVTPSNVADARRLP